MTHGNGNPLATGDRLQSVSRAIAVLDMLAQHPAGETAKGVAAALCLSTSTAYHLLNTLIAGGLVARDPVTRLFALGPRLPHLNEGYLARGRPTSNSLPFLHALNQATGEMVCLTRLIGDDAVIVALSPGANPGARDLGYVGFAMPAHLTASGQALLAWETPARVQTYIAGHYGFSSGALLSVNPTQFVAELQRIRTVGFARDAGSSHPDIWCIAAPIVLTGARAEESLSVVSTRTHFAAHEASIIAATLSLARAASDAMTQPSGRHQAQTLPGTEFTAAAVKSLGLPG